MDAFELDVSDLDILSIGTHIELRAYYDARSAYAQHPELKPEYATTQSRDRFREASTAFVGLTLFLNADHGTLKPYPETVREAAEYLREFPGSEGARMERRAISTLETLADRLADRTRSAREMLSEMGPEATALLDDEDIVSYLGLAHTVALMRVFDVRVNDELLPVPPEAVEDVFLDR